jgi:indolepyruvate decarboxylase
MTKARSTIGQYLVQRLGDVGVRHVFGIPGDYVLGFYDLLVQSPIKVIGTTKEDGAGFAADAYARANGIGALCVTYGVGGLSVVNPVAGAYAEKSPVVVITGSPGLRERADDPLLHHKVRTFATQKEIFEQVTAAAVVLDDPDTAFRAIDETLATCVREKRPVYIELPRDMVGVAPAQRHEPRSIEERSDPASLAEALEETIERLNRAKRPVILADVEMHRYGLGKDLETLADRTGYPVAATILGKSILKEVHPNFLGIYQGAMSRPEVQKAVEASDGLLMLGTVLCDINTGVFTAKVDPARTISATSQAVQISRHRFDKIRLSDFVQGLLRAPLRRWKGPLLGQAPAATQKIRRGGPITVTGLFELLNRRLTDRMAVICDVGLSMFAAVDLVIRNETKFFAPAYYASMGFGIPAALGVASADPKLRPVVLVGDGAFQMTGVELSSIVKAGLDPIVLLLNNRGYTTERFIQDGPYNDILDWRYEKLPDLLGAGWGAVVRTEKEFAAAWDRATERRGSFSLLNIHLDPKDHCPALVRLGEGLSAQLRT